MREKRADKPQKAVLWEVGCDDHADAWVTAETWEEATVKAAEFWDVPWREVAAYCYVKRRTEAVLKNVCAKCGKHISSGNTLCGPCAMNLRDEEIRLRERLKKAYRAGQLA